LLATIAAAAGLAFFYLSQSSHVAALRAEQQQLELQIGLAHAPSTVLGEATTQLHLSPLTASSVSFARGASVTPSPRPSPEPTH